MCVYFEIIFDNGGGITLQTEGFCHNYDRPEWAARDVKVLLAEDNTDGWEGDDPEARDQEYDPEMERNGGYKWLTRQEVEEVIASGTIDSSWRNMRDFFVALGCAVGDS